MSLNEVGPLYVSAVPWNRENVLAILPLLDCKMCGECCRFCHPILVQEQELWRVADYLDVKASTLKKRWKVEQRPEGKVWLIPGLPCEFQKGNLCSIHEVRMVVCKYWPLVRIDTLSGPVIGVSSHLCHAGDRAVTQLELMSKSRFVEATA